MFGAAEIPKIAYNEIEAGHFRKEKRECGYGAGGAESDLRILQVANFLVGLLFLRLLEQLGPRALYSMFASACLVAAVFVKKNVVETKGKSLQEIEISLLSP